MRSGYAEDSSRLLRTLGVEVLVLFGLIVGYARTAPLRKRWKAVRRFRKK